MRTRIGGARLQARRVWLIAAATCFIPTYLLSDASLQPADAMMMRERPAMGGMRMNSGPRMDGGMHRGMSGGNRMHSGGHRSHGYRGGGFRGGAAVGLGFAVGGIVLDQIQRQQDARDEARDVPARGHANKPRQHIGTASSPRPKNDPPRTARSTNNDKPVYPRNQNTPSSANKKDDPRSGRTDAPLASGSDPGDVPVVHRDDPRDATSTRTRDPGLKAPPEFPTGRPPVTPALIPPSTPVFVSNPVPQFGVPQQPPAWHCRDCKELERWIERLKNQIENDEKKLANAEKNLKEREQERDDLKDKVKRSKGIQKAYYQDRLEWVEDYIDKLDTYNGELRDIIDEEKKVLERLKAEYNKCADPQCKKVPEAPPVSSAPPPERPKLPPVTSAPPRETPTPVVFSPPQPVPTSTPASGPCDDHWAELTNGKRKFHRLYVLGLTNSQEEREFFVTIQDNLKTALEGPGRQAPQSTSKDMKEPTAAEFRSEMQRLADVVQPCEEVTLNILAHGGGGITNGTDLPALTPGGETKAELIHLAKTYDQKTGAPEYQKLFDRELGEMIKKFKPNVSVTVLMYSCWGGGFAGKGNVEESKLVKLIGTYSQCRPFEFNNEIRKGVDDLAGKSKDGRVTAIEIKDHLLQKGWPLGQPFDSPLDRYVNERLDEYLPRSVE